MSPLRLLQLLAALGEFSSPAALKHGVTEVAQTPSIPAATLPLRASSAPPPPRQAHRKLAARSGGLQAPRGHEALPDEMGTPGHDEGHASVAPTTVWSELAKSARPAQDPLAMPHYAPPTKVQRLGSDALKRLPSTYEGSAVRHRNVTSAYTVSMDPNMKHGPPRASEDS